MFGASAVGTTAVVAIALVAIALVAISRNGEVLAKYSRNSLGEERARKSRTISAAGCMRIQAPASRLLRQSSTFHLIGGR